MRIEPHQDRFIQGSITALLFEHINQPFAILREAGLVAELRGKLISLGGFGLTEPLFRKFPARDKICTFDRSHVSTGVSRVQMEVQVTLGGRGFSSTPFPEAGPFPTTKVLDIGVLRECPILHCARNGAGDVVQQIGLDSLSAAIEVKASPSLMPEQRGHYVKDVWALLELANLGIASYFVLVDKTSGLYGAPAHALQSGNAMSWDAVSDQDILVRKGVAGDYPFSTLEEAGISLACVEPKAPHVQIWRIAATEDGFAPKKIYASSNRRLMQR